MPSRGAVLALLGAAACSEDPARVLAAVTTALHAGDRDAVERRVHPEYSDPLGDKAALLRDLGELLDTYGRVDLTPSELEVLPGESGPSIVALVGKLEARVEGTPSMRFEGPLVVQMLRGRKTLIRSGLLDDLRGIRALMAARRAAFEANDAKAYASLIHPAYRDGDLDRDGAIARLTHDLGGVRVRENPLHFQIEVRGPIAHVDERFTVTIGEREQAPALARLTLRRSAGRWAISSGLYAGANLAQPPE